MHWATAARLIEALELQGSQLLDPFCGSGTVPIEAAVHGCTAYGLDLNPLAVRLSRVKSRPLDASMRTELPLAASALRAQSEELVQTRANVRANLPASEVAFYEPHVLKEMAGLYGAIEALPDSELREPLRFVFSSLVVKFSRQRSDTSTQLTQKRLRKGLVSEFFERKAFELAERLTHLAAALPGPSPEIVEGDVRALPELSRIKFDAVISSPPYGGTYDYAEHHARRMAWLGLSPRDLLRGELGARRRAGESARFASEMHAALRALRGVLRRDAQVYLLMGDGQHGAERVAADELIGELAPETGFLPRAVASQARPDFQGGPPRAEHLMALVAR